MKRIPLTRQDLFAAKSTGYGYLGHPCRTVDCYSVEAAKYASFDPYAAIKKRDLAVIKAANKVKLSVARFCDFLDSRAGRYLGDALSPDLSDVQIKTAAHLAVLGWDAANKSR